MQRRMLTREEEAASGAEEIEVRREDQEKINKFSRLHQKELSLEEELKTKDKDKQDLEEVASELELSDDDDLIPYLIGDFFVDLRTSEVQELLSASSARLDGEISELREQLGDLREEIQQLKVELYARFGTSINLDY